MITQRIPKKSPIYKFQLLITRILLVFILFFLSCLCLSHVQFVFIKLTTCQKIEHISFYWSKKTYEEIIFLLCVIMLLQKPKTTWSFFYVRNQNPLLWEAKVRSQNPLPPCTIWRLRFSINFLKKSLSLYIQVWGFFKRKPRPLPISLTW
jgi:hypothetical protein